MTLSMTCEQFEDILPQLLDDDAMPVPPAARLHLEGCVECKTLYDDLAGIRTTAAALPPIVPSRDLWAGIEARIRTPVVPLVEGMPARKQRRQISLRSAAIAAGLLALVNAGVSYTYMYVRRPAPVTTQAEAPAQMPAPIAMRTAAPAEPLMSLPLRVVAMPPATPRRTSAFVLAPACRPSWTAAAANSTPAPSRSSIVTSASSTRRSSSATRHSCETRRAHS